MSEGNPGIRSKGALLVMVLVVWEMTVTTAAARGRPTRSPKVTKGHAKNPGDREGFSLSSVGAGEA
ncbi:hypothetical protein EYF80_067823 [Liparis tanakae]|uniref:Uncharacterized protein n=1 Tax=Liparis tanakae TaxID=230148 RepID=A0A4Z2DZX0_9TELE|nr:hypothetical protein EYF80_067823 [Liparis tanakae]